MSIRLADGAMIGRYRIDGLLAEGGMGVVYRARQLELDLPVALKVIRPEWAHDDDFRARFKREARLAASLHHPHVVSPHDFGDHDGQLFVVMPLIPGTDLGTVIEHDGPLAPARAADVIGQVAAALDVAHANGLVHRDVKPANVLLVTRDDREHAYLTDFGVAKAISSDTRITRLGQLPGTPGYVSPEQINGDPLDARTDVYSLGCVLCEALTGSVPYPRQTPAAMLIAHMMDAPPRISERMPDTPAGFDDVVGRALAKDPGERYGSAGELAGAARAAAAASDPAPAVTRPRARPARRPPAPAEPVPHVPESGPEAPPARRRLGALARAQRDGTGPVPARMGLGALAALGLAAALGSLVAAWAIDRITQDDSFDIYAYGDRSFVLALFGAILTAALALGAGLAARVGRKALLTAAAAAAGIGFAGGLLGAAPYGWDTSPRRWLATVWVITGLAAGIGVTILSRSRRTILLAAGLGALGGGAGAIIARGIFTTDEVLGNAGFGPFAVAEMISGTGVGLAVGLALLLGARERERPGTAAG